MNKKNYNKQSFTYMLIGGIAPGAVGPILFGGGPLMPP